MPVGQFHGRGACACGCGEGGLDDDVVDGLLTLEKIACTRLSLLSGYRCAKHNEAVGSKPTSMHRLRKAADVFSSNVDATMLAALAEGVAVFANGGIGLYVDKRFVHLDTGKKRRWCA